MCFHTPAQKVDGGFIPLVYMRLCRSARWSISSLFFTDRAHSFRIAPASSLLISKCFSKKDRISSANSQFLSYPCIHLSSSPAVPGKLRPQNDAHSQMDRDGLCSLVDLFHQFQHPIDSIALDKTGRGKFFTTFAQFSPT